MTMVVVCVAAENGAGKTTLALALAVHWSRAGHHVLLVDCDPRTTLATRFGARQDKDKIEMMASGVARFEAHVTREAVGDEYDFIIIDTAGSQREFGPAIKFANIIMMPVQLRSASLFAFERTFSFCQSFDVPIVVAPNRVKRRGTNSAEPAFSAACEGRALIAEPIGDVVDYATYSLQGLSIVDIDPTGTGAVEIANLAKTLCDAAQKRAAPASTAEQVAGSPSQPSPRRSRSKRGVDPETHSQVCFKVSRDMHHALKVHCAEHSIEVGEAMEKAVAWVLSTGQRR